MSKHENNSFYNVKIHNNPSRYINICMAKYPPYVKRSDRNETSQPSIVLIEFVIEVSTNVLTPRRIYEDSSSTLLEGTIDNRGWIGVFICDTGSGRKRNKTFSTKQPWYETPPSLFPLFFKLLNNPILWEIGRRIIL